MSHIYTTHEIRTKFLDFFRAHSHAIIPGASVVPREDPTALFTTAGMHPLVPYLLGMPHPAGKRLADAQLCIRTVDIDEVGDDTHLTCFEMLGNWSLGDYFKEESIAMTWEFLTDEKWLGIDPSKLAMTCFEGDDTVGKDVESAALWEKMGVPTDRIFFYGRDDNWWGPAGTTGPCGPDTEVFYWTGDGDPESEPAKDARWVEIWNNVFMQFDKRDDGTYEPLPAPNVDTGLGLERTALILNGMTSVHQIDAFAPIIAVVKELSTNNIEASQRIVADHVRAAVAIAASGVAPSNLDRGYVLRRLIRRAIRHGRTLGIATPFIIKVVAPVIELWKEAYPEIAAQAETVADLLSQEEARFARTLEQGLREFTKVADRGVKELDGKTVFTLYDTYGFPLEMTQELADERGLIVDVNGFNEAFKTHQEKSRTATAGTFTSGLADHGEMTVKYHTTTHLLNQALHQVLGDHVAQRGSNITGERIRFDFSNPAKLTDEQKQAIEDLVNEQIAADLPVSVTEMLFEDAQAAGAISVPGERYPEKVTVYSVGDYSKEICTGPHVERTGGLGTFKIIKEESAGAGIRRIKAILS